MEMLFRQLLKKLNGAYPNSVTDEELIKDGIREEVIRDALSEKLVERVGNFSVSIITNDDECSETAEKTKSALKITFKGSEYLRKFEPTSKTINKTIVSNSHNFVAQSGGKHNKGVINDTTNPAKLRVAPYSSFQQGLIGFGRWFMLKSYGELDHSLLGLTFTISLSSGVVVLPFFATFLGKNISLFLSQIPTYITQAALIISIMGWWIIIASEKTRCPKCNKKFAYTRKSRILENWADLSEKEVRNYKSTYSCDFCKYLEKGVDEVEEYDHQ